MIYTNLKIVKQEVDFAEWFQTTVKAGLIAKNSPVPGCQILEVNGADTWKQIEHRFDPSIRELGYRNKSWPALIPMSVFMKEENHIEGFSPELAMVNELKGKELEDKLCLRPTSETIIYDDMANVVQSAKDLPIFWNQWCDVWRVELRTKLLLRTFQFSWHEAHWAIEKREDALNHTLNAQKKYKEFFHDILAIPVIDGEKSELERFAGAEKTFTIEARMPDGKALQAATSHLMSKGFSEAYDITFTDKDGLVSYPFTGSWGMSTRILGALVMTHSDNKGLVLPPKISPHQVVLMTVSDSKTIDCEKFSKKLKEIENILKNSGIRYSIDENNERLGKKQYHWEKQGIPIRIIFGSKEVYGDDIALIRRDTGEKITVLISNLADEIIRLLEVIQLNLFHLAEKRLDDNIIQVANIKEFEEVLSNTENAFFSVGWCDEPEEETLLREKYGYTVRCYPNTPKSSFSNCFMTGKQAKTQAIIAKAY